MKKLILLISIVSAMYGCKQDAGYREETCSSFQKIRNTKTLKLQDSLPGLSGISDAGIHFSSRNLHGKFILIFLKIDPDNKNIYLLINEEMRSQNIGVLTKNKGGNIIVSNDLKLASIFGIKESADKKTRSNYLFVTNGDALLTAKYNNVCEKDIVNIVNGL